MAEKLKAGPDPLETVEEIELSPRGHLDALLIDLTELGSLPDGDKKIEDLAADAFLHAVQTLAGTDEAEQQQINTALKDSTEKDTQLHAVTKNYLTLANNFLLGELTIKHDSHPDMQSMAVAKAERTAEIFGLGKPNRTEAVAITQKLRQGSAIAKPVLK